MSWKPRCCKNCGRALEFWGIVNGIEGPHDLLANTSTCYGYCGDCNRLLTAMALAEQFPDAPQDSWFKKALIAA
jgi:hypothetical protein